MLFAKLPPIWQELVVRQQAKLRERRPWVRVTYPDGVDGDDVLTAVEMHTQQPLPKFSECTRGYVFQTATEEARDTMLELHNAKIDGSRLSATQHEYEMTGDEILAFVSKRLRSDAELQAAREAYPSSSPAKVQAVNEETAELQVVKFSGNSGKGAQHVSGGRRNSPGKKTSYPNSSKGKKQSSPQAPQHDDTWCNTCRTAGRSFVHDFRKCEHFRKAAEILAARNPALANSLCRTCCRAGRPADHDYRKCEHVWQVSGKVRQRIEQMPTSSPPPKASE